MTRNHLSFLLAKRLKNAITKPITELMKIDNVAVVTTLTMLLGKVTAYAIYTGCVDDVMDFKVSVARMVEQSRATFLKEFEDAEQRAKESDRQKYN